MHRHYVPAVIAEPASRHPLDNNIYRANGDSLRMADGSSQPRLLADQHVTVAHNDCTLEYQLTIIPGQAEHLLVGQDVAPHLGLVIGGIGPDFPSRLRDRKLEQDPDWMDPLACKPDRFRQPVLSAADEASRAALLTKVNAALAVNNATNGPDSFIHHQDAEVEIVHKPGTVPKFRRQYPLPPRHQDTVDTQISEWILNRRVVPFAVLDPAPGKPSYPLWGFSFTVAESVKSDGSIAARVCPDLRPVNTDTVVDQYPLPNFKLFLRNQAHKIWSGIDLVQCFQQFPLSRGSQEKVSFTWRGKVYMFQSATWGLSMVSQHVQRFFANLFADLPEVMVYVDDLLIATSTWAEHERVVLLVIERLTAIGARISVPKSRFGFLEIKALGMLLTQTGLAVSPDKVDEVMAWPAPTTPEQLQHQLGVLGFLRDHIRHFADLTAPLERLKRLSPKNFVFDGEAKRCWLLLKELIAHLPELCPYDPLKRPAITLDGSGDAVGAVLYYPDFPGQLPQPHNIVAFCSRILKQRERALPAYRLELTSLTYALNKFHDWVWGRDFDVFTDHRSLVYLHTSPALNRTLQNWLAFVQHYRFSIAHVPGVLNVCADSLSRLYVAKEAKWTWGCASHAAIATVNQVTVVLARLSNASRALSVLRVQTRAARAAASAAGQPAVLPPPPAELVPAVVSVNELAPLVDRRTGRRALPEEADSAPPLPLLEAAPAEGLIPACVVPESPDHALALVEECHAFGHWGRSAVMERLRRNGFNWPGMEKLVRQVSDNCRACQLWAVHRAKYSQMAPIIALQPFQHVQMDIASGWPVSPSGHRFLLLLVDALSGFLILLPLRDKKAPTIAKELFRLFCLLGWPGILQADNEPTLRADVVTELLRMAQVQYQAAVAYNPRNNGYVERDIGTVRAAINKLLSATGVDWAALCPMVQLMFNDRYADRIGSNAFQVFFNRPSGGFQVYTNVPLSDDPMWQQYNTWKARLHHQQDVVWPQIVERSNAKHLKSIAHFHGRHEKAFDPLPLGCVVMLEDKLQQSKGEPPYVGPYTVMRFADNKYSILDAQGVLFHRDVTRDMLKALPLASKPEQEYRVETITGHKTDPATGETQYWVLFAGYPDAYLTPVSDISDMSLINTYWASVRRLPRSRRPVVD